MDETLGNSQSKTFVDPFEDELDLKCEACGYSLRGLAGKRCPECGREFDPTRLPRARIYWLRRTELGLATAYFQTVRQIILHPRRFAHEFRRPNTIPVAAGEKFLLLNTWIAVFSVVCLPGIGAIISFIPHRFPTGNPMVLVRLACVLAALGTFTGVFFRMAIILPASAALSFRTSRMASILDYTSAPAVFIPLWGLSFGAFLAAPTSRWADRIAVVCVVLGCANVALIWIAQVALVSILERFEGSWILFFAIRLTLHWLFAAFVAFIAAFFLAVMVMVGGSALVQ